MKPLNVVDVLAKVQEFNKLSKHGVGVHMFQFKKDDDTVYIGSEVTDDNNILDVKYKQWEKAYVLNNGTKVGNQFPNVETSKLREDWTPSHAFSSGRVAAIAVFVLVKNGYVMKLIKPK